MARNITPEMLAHVNTELTSLASCWTLYLKDGAVLRITDHDVDIEYVGETYLASVGVSRTAMQATSTMAVDNMDLAGMIDNDQIKDEELRAGRYDGAKVECVLVNHEDPDLYGEIKLRKGTLGEVRTDPIAGQYETEFRGLLDAFTQSATNTYQSECRVDLGSTKCGVVLDAPGVERSTSYLVGDLVTVAEDPKGVQYVCTTSGTTDATPPTYNDTIGASTVDGTATFTAELSLTQQVEVIEVLNNRAFKVSVPLNDVIAVDDWFKYGRVIFNDGLNAGFVSQTKAYVQADNEVRMLTAAPYTMQVGDSVSLQVGCGKTLVSYCRDKFDNVINFRAEPFIPGSNQFLQYPDAK